MDDGLHHISLEDANQWMPLNEGILKTKICIICGEEFTEVDPRQACPRCRKRRQRSKNPRPLRYDGQSKFCGWCGEWVDDDPERCPWCNRQLRAKPHNGGCRAKYMDKESELRTVKNDDDILKDGILPR